MGSHFLMPSPQILDLVRRDSKLRGLAFVLDAGAMASVLARRWPECDFHSGEVSYIRYKPGRRCLVLFRIVADGCARQFVVTAHNDAHWLKETARAARPSADRDALHLVPEQHVTMTKFPNDPSIRILPRLHEPDAASALITRLFPNDPPLWHAEILPLAYKPDRRFVGMGRVGGTARFALKAYASPSYPATTHTAKPFASRGLLRIPNRIARSRRHRLVAYEWLDGRLLSNAMRHPDFRADEFVPVGIALAQLHRQHSCGLAISDPTRDAASIDAVADDVAFLLPDLRARLHEVSRRTSRHLRESTASPCPIHGDFYAKQVLLCDRQIGIVDFDQSTLGDAGRDLGNFCAKLEIAALRGEISTEAVECFRESFLKGYRQHLRIDERSLPFQTTAGLIRCLPYPFRQGLPNWPEQTLRILETIEAALPVAAPARARDVRKDRPRLPSAPASVTVSAVVRKLLSDPNLPHAAAALDLKSVQSRIERNIPQLRSRYGAFAVTNAHVLRHKRNRRCLIQYTLSLANSQTPDTELRLVGKMRSKGLDRRTYKLQRRLWEQGFDDRSADAVSVPEPLGVIPELAMWLQPMIPGVTATHQLNQPGHDDLAERIATALAKLHAASLPTARRHTLNDELRILQKRFAQTAADHPELSSPLQTLFGECQRVAHAIPPCRETGIHRDFYADQVLIADDRIYLLDLDLYASGDPALDAGNFVGHLVEQGIRCPQDADRLGERAQDFTDWFVSTSGGSEETVDSYKFLTLARHVALSTVIPGRSHTTQQLLEWCSAGLSDAFRPLMSRSGMDPTVLTSDTAT